MTAGLTLAVDAMSGDHGAEVAVPAALDVLASTPDLRLIIVGRGEVVRALALAGGYEVVDDAAGHANADALAREAQLFLIEDLFHRTLGGDAPPPADAEMRAWLRTHARVAAPGVSGEGLR